MNRRRFLACCGALPLCPALAHGGAAGGRPRLQDNPSFEAFQAYQGEVFRVYGGGGVRWVEEFLLSRVVDKGSTGDFEQFLLEFHGPAASTLDKNSYFFEHPEGGRFTLWLEPGEVRDGVRIFEVRFSTLKGFDPSQAPGTGR